MKTQYLFGEWREETSALTADEAARLCRQAETWRERLADYPLDKTLRLLGRVRRRWLDPSYSHRRACESLLPGVTGFSPEMVRRGIEELCWTFDPEFLQKKLRTELRGSLNEGLGAAHWEPLGIVLHVLAGNVFVGAAGSLVEGLITGNVNILKMSSSDNIFLPRLVASLRECDEEDFLSQALAVVEYSSSQADVIEEFKKRVDAVVVWGGEEAVRAYRDRLPARTRLIVFGPKLSFGLVTREGLRRRAPEFWAGCLAREASLWDQNACTAPQLCYVQGLEEAKRLVSALPQAFSEAAKALPPGRIDADSAVEIRKIRSVFEVAEARGEGALLESARGLDWTVLLDRDPAIEPSPLHRTLRVVAFDDFDEVVGAMRPLRGYIQTVGLAASQMEQAQLCRRLLRAGALRVVELGKMAEGEIDDPHDGRYDLPQFKHLCLARLDVPEDWDPASSLSSDDKRRLIDGRLRRLIDRAALSPFYRRRLQGIQIQTAADLPRLPILTREEMEANMPPQGEGLATGPWQGGYVSRSGGSTGEPKFSIYDRHDWENLVSHAAGIFASLGLRETDRLANFMLAGDLYGSFVSFDHINARVGLASFAFAGNSKPEAFLLAWRKFAINAVQGIPSQLIPFLRAAKKLGSELTLEKVVYAGAPLSPSDRRWLETELRTQRIASVLGANDGGQIGYQCAHMSGALHHAVDDFNYLEIVDESGRPVPDGTAGRILITSLLKHAFPLIRYAIGDQGRIVSDPCPCGRRARVFEYLGRADDILSVAMMNVHYRDFARALAELPLSTVQLAARNDENGESIILRAESDDPSERLKTGIREALLKSLDKLRERLDEGTLSQLHVELYRPGELPRNARSGKVKSVVDERA
ncbi:MAG: hypothetical protein HY551_07610 [Elusimicrobia bacterium]|nr:hypothetical protein [Elusimicrobiota bacterium]